jgi:hypothetical protein
MADTKTTTTILAEIEALSGARRKAAAMRELFRSNPLAAQRLLAELFGDEN